MALWTIACMFSVLFECRLSLWAAWGSTYDIIDKCYDTLRFIYAVCLSDFIADVIIVVIPIPLVSFVDPKTYQKLNYSRSGS